MHGGESKSRYARNAIALQKSEYPIARDCGRDIIHVAMPEFAWLPPGLDNLDELVDARLPREERLAQDHFCHHATHRPHGIKNKIK